VEKIHSSSEGGGTVIDRAPVLSIRDSTDFHSSQSPVRSTLLVTAASISARQMGGQNVFGGGPEGSTVVIC
jgi:hypothetical protein